MTWDAPHTEDEQFLMESFEANFERRREQSGRSLAPFVRESARVQVLLCYRRLKELAAKVEETEVRLVLPEQVSPSGRTYTLEGVVDIVEDGDSTVMYDLKTFLDADAAREHVEPHYRQLNVYAHIWRGLRGQSLDEVAVIATRPTRKLKRALRAGIASRINAELDAWEPVLTMELDEDVVADVMTDFGRVVDLIEDRSFGPSGIEILRSPSRPKGSTLFAQDVCLNCDARFGCASYRQFVRMQSPGRADTALRVAADDFGGAGEKDDWRDSGLTQRPRVEMDDGDSE